MKCHNCKEEVFTSLTPVQMMDGDVEFYCNNCYSEVVKKIYISEDMAYFMAKAWVKYINDNYPKKWTRLMLVTGPKEVKKI